MWFHMRSEEKFDTGYVKGRMTSETPVSRFWFRNLQKEEQWEWLMTLFFWGGHLGVKKTEDRIQTNFFWPGLHEDVTSFCRSCDVCQKTVSGGSAPRAPLGDMPLIDQPFKRVAIDIVGPIAPASNKRHRYILTLVDYATRYPEAVPLKNIHTETVAEALLDMCSRVGVPKKVLSDLGTQFTSDCMKEVSRLLSIRRLTTYPYHPACNGLAEKFNGTLKRMLRR